MAEKNKWLPRFRELKAAQEARRASAQPATPADAPTAQTVPAALDDPVVASHNMASERQRTASMSLPLPPPVNCLEPEAHRRSGHLWHDVPGLGWYCIAWTCLPEEVKMR